MDKSLAASLWNARQNGNCCDGVDALQSIGDAYELQSQCDVESQQEIIGYKVGATSDETLGILGLSEPFFGPLYKRYSQLDSNTAEFTVFSGHNPRVEAEFVVCLKTKLKKQGGDVSLNDVISAVDWVAPGFEFVGSRLNHSDATRGLAAIADFGANLYFVVGSPIKNWASLNLESYPVSLIINEDKDNEVKGHSGLSIYGHPFAFVAWLANQSSFAESGLPAGTLISCGTCTGAPFVKAGDEIAADFGQMGKLHVRLLAG